MNQKTKEIINFLFKIAFTINLIISLLSTILMLIARRKIPDQVYTNYALLLIVAVLIYLDQIGEKE